MTRFSLIAKNLVLLLRSTERSPNASLFQAFSWLGRSAENIARKITKKKARREEALSLFFLRCASTNWTLGRAYSNEDWCEIFFGTRHGWIDGIGHPAECSRGENKLCHRKALAYESVLISKSFARWQWVLYRANQRKHGLFRRRWRVFVTWLGQLFILHVHEHDFESPCFGMITVGTTIFHWLYFDRIWWLVPFATDSSVFIRSNIVWNQWKSNLKARSMRLSLNQGTVM